MCGNTLSITHIQNGWLVGPWGIAICLECRLTPQVGIIDPVEA